jgi:hypothetical protein
MKDNANSISARPLFPLFETYLSLVKQEVNGLSKSEVNWTSAKWSWSGWSIKDNVSHVTSHLFRWYILRWGSKLFPKELPFADELHDLAGLPSRRLSKAKWDEMDAILSKLEQSLELIRQILENETETSILTKNIIQGGPGFYGLISNRYPGTQYQDPEFPSIWHLTLAGTFHHSEGELTTHLFNVQRLKLAQGFESQVTLPRIGYWTLPNWDTTIP